MNVVITIVALVIVGVGVFVSRTGKINSLDNNSLEKNNPVSEEVLSSTASDDGQQPTPTSEVIQTLTLTPFPQTPTKTPVATPRDSIFYYQYPNSHVVDSSETSLLLESTDDPDTLTSWYKEKIASQNMNVKTFISTKTNDNVLNRLVGANGTKEIAVQIEKKSGDDNVKISISITY